MAKVDAKDVEAALEEEDNIFNSFFGGDDKAEAEPTQEAAVAENSSAINADVKPLDDVKPTDAAIDYKAIAERLINQSEADKLENNSRYEKLQSEISSRNELEAGLKKQIDELNQKLDAATPLDKDIIEIMGDEESAKKLNAYIQKQILQATKGLSSVDERIASTVSKTLEQREAEQKQVIAKQRVDSFYRKLHDAVPSYQKVAENEGFINHLKSTKLGVSTAFDNFKIIANNINSGNATEDEIAHYVTVVSSVVSDYEGTNKPTQTSKTIQSSRKVETPVSVDADNPFNSWG